MLQNEKYLDFADENTVEVLALQQIEDGIKKGDRRAETYDAKDENGNPVKYLKEFAGMTVEQVQTLNTSPAGQYNKTGKIPYVGIVNPFTQQEIKSMPGGGAAGQLMDAVAEARIKLNKEHGPSLKRSVLRKFDAAAKGVETTLAKDPAKALAELRKLQSSVAKEPEALRNKATALETKVMEGVVGLFEKAESLIDSGDVKAAEKMLKPLVSPLKGTEHEARVKELLAKTKPASPDAK